MTDNLPPLPEPGMQETNPYLDLGPMDPHKGVSVLRWFSADQMREYALAARSADEALMEQVFTTITLASNFMARDNDKQEDIGKRLDRDYASLRARLAKPEGTE